MGVGSGKEGKGKTRKKRKQFKRPIQNNKQTIITATVRYYLYTQHTVAKSKATNLKWGYFSGTCKKFTIASLRKLLRK